MNKLIIAAAMVLSFAAQANDHAAKKETKATTATTTTTTTAPVAAPAPGTATATMTPAEAEKACKAEKAKDMAACVAGKVHKM